MYNYMYIVKAKYNRQSVLSEKVKAYPIIHKYTKKSIRSFGIQ
ncbi:hypothetical protein M2101_001443 [Parabacteroides sp. PM5-20]|nr:hypothetical protein [Parabacteroides sp. PM5-20]